MSGSSRIDDIIQAGYSGESVDDLPKPQSRAEDLLIRLIKKTGPGGDGSAIDFHICSSGEYDPVTGVPTISSPSETTFYFVPGGSGNDLYSEWVYLDGSWEKIASGSAVAATALGGLSDVVITGPADKQTLVYDTEQRIWKNAGLRDFCFVSGNDDDPYVVGGANADDLT